MVWRTVLYNVYAVYLLLESSALSYCRVERKRKTRRERCQGRVNIGSGFGVCQHVREHVYIRGCRSQRERRKRRAAAATTTRKKRTVNKLLRNRRNEETEAEQKGREALNKVNRAFQFILAR